MTGITPTTRAAARRLRQKMTLPERRLWQQLRDLNRRLGLHFRRQAPIGPYIADFADLGRRIVIEVDGGQHGQPDGAAHDGVRDAWLRAQGFAVLRFWNIDVGGNVEGVMQRILDALEIPPPPHPSPTRGEGGAFRARSARPAGPVASPPPRGEGMGVGGHGGTP
ncbi:MAG: endonuclease domain-containing protein [Gemmobacter sp.]